MKLEPYGIQAPIFVSLQLGHARILEEDEEGLLLEDRKAGIQILDVKDAHKGALWLRRHQKPGLLVMVLREAVFQRLLQLLPVQTHGPCLQGVWADKPPVQEKIRLVPAGLEDLQRLAESYDLADEDELGHALEDGRLFAGMVGHSRIGVCGLHPEGAMGMLYVWPEFRRCGFGQAMLLELVKTARQRGLIPYAQVFADNAPSILMQRQAGMTFCDDLVCWLKFPG